VCDELLGVGVAGVVVVGEKETLGAIRIQAATAVLENELVEEDHHQRRYGKDEGLRSMGAKRRRDQSHHHAEAILGDHRSVAGTIGAAELRLVQQAVTICVGLVKELGENERLRGLLSARDDCRKSRGTEQGEA